MRMKLAHVLQREVRDPRVAGVHVTRVELAKDLSRARVFWRTMPGGASEERARIGLAQAAGLLRSRVGGSLRVRHVPELVFELDRELENESRLESLLAGARPAPAPARPEEDE
jgi:ribosome-binding factor A